MNMEMEIQPPIPAPFNHHLPQTSCDRHPGEPVIGFCASCLRERLAGLEATEVPRKSTSNALKSIFFRSSGASSNSFHQPELRRCKSFSSSRATAAAVEPQRKSCDVRTRNTLSSLFHQDDRDHGCLNLGFPPSITVPVEERSENIDEIVAASDEEMVEEEKEEPLAEMKPMKDHIDLDSQAKKLPPKDLKDIAGSFWLAASVFSKKLGIWRRKQKLKKKPENRVDTIGTLGTVGRRSCDIEPRFSLDAGRFSFDDPRFSWDEPRASWDGYLISGGRTMHPRLPSMLSVVEDAPAVVVQRFDGEIPVEEDLVVPGGALQTRDYYEGRRRSLDRSSSTRKQSFETNEILLSSHGSKHERDSRELFAESFDSGLRDQRPKVPPLKKSRRWSKAWNIWAFIHRRNVGRNRSNEVERSFSETWPELQANRYNRSLFRSNSNVSLRSSASVNGGIGSMSRNGLDRNGHRMKKKKEEVVLERNRSARYSPSHFDNGLLRFYLPPMKDGRRGRGWGRNKYSSPHSFTGSMLSLY
ncbi:UPF0503 protein At3g09070, chloroplastic-like [Phalaenopsis equestris]|uniref:UPF0503 protein At3g09070, chloroplastic-like n=1 Tax=Phalaenopsis equestris TaxID=78828 RepID=UPI0009E31C95|nr:UPF0503 protein At3g09070, chloroplastic-like [Phalaenopsis equestris]